MRKTKNILSILEETVPDELLPLLKQLFEEIEDFFRKLDLYFHYHKNEYLFEAIYIKNLSNIVISNDLPIDVKGITKFKKDTEEFIISLMMNCQKYKELISYLDKK